MPKKSFSQTDLEHGHLQNVESYASAVDRLYNQAIADFSRLAKKIKINPEKLFSFNDYPAAKSGASKIIEAFNSRLQQIIATGSREQWLYANKKSDAFLQSILNTSKVRPNLLNRMQDRNLDALKAFQGRKVNGMDLSQRIWYYTGQFKEAMELGIDVGIGAGKSAQQLSRELRGFLLEPDNLFRRVRDKHGNLVLSKAAKAFHPGQGVYRSSYKNAMRLTRSEINMSYRTADDLRWNQLNFVVGFEIKLSNNHTLNGKPFRDICDELAGKYPKTFRFVGWHPQCRCFKVPVMMDPDEFNTDELNELKAALNGKEYKKYVSKNTVSDVPGNFKDWIAKNQVKIDGYKSTPYFIKDNFNNGKIADGLSIATKRMKPVKSQAQKEVIQKAWNTRQTSKKYNGEVNDIADQYKEVESISNYAVKIQNEIKTGSSVEKIDTMVQKLKNKVSVKEAWEVRREENQLGTILADVKGLKAKYDKATIQNLYNAVEAKLKGWENLSLADQKKKLLFEVNWVEQNKKYDTWKAAQDAYKKHLSKVEYLIEKDSVKSSISKALDFAKSTKSTIVKQQVKELQLLLDNNASIAALKEKAVQLNTKVDKLINDRAAKEAKKKLPDLTGLDNDKFSKARKNKALWAKTPNSADDKFRPTTRNVWNASTLEEKQAAFEYTRGSGGFNRPLRGYQGSWSEFDYKGVGKADLNYEGRGKQIESLTKMIDKSFYNFDVWLQRGVESTGTAKFLGVDYAKLFNMSASELQSLVGKIVNEPAFTSCGSAKGKGFPGHIFNIYCPAGTKMVYAEPFSHYGGSYGTLWNGVSKNALGSELETIIQRNTTFRITKVERTGGRVYIDMEVVAQ